jgi:nucleotide-binding universal stress UspA family protein
MHNDKPILVAYDGSEPSDVALRWALDEAQRRHLALTILHADTPELDLTGRTLGYYEAKIESTLADGEAILTEGETKCAAWAPEVPISPRLVAQAPAYAVLDAMSDASMIVLGARGLEGFLELLAGSTTLQVAAHSSVPVVVVRAGRDVVAGPEAGRVVVGVDSSDSGRDALSYAFEEASVRHVGLTALRAWQSGFFDTGAKGGVIPPSMEDEVLLPTEADALHDEVAGWRTKYPDVDVREVLAHAKAADALTDASRGAELVVVGSRGRGAVRTALLGSVSHAVMKHAECPVAVVRPAERG